MACCSSTPVPRTQPPPWRKEPSPSPDLASPTSSAGNPYPSDDECDSGGETPPSDDGAGACAHYVEGDGGVYRRLYSARGEHAQAVAGLGEHDATPTASPPRMHEPFDDAADDAADVASSGFLAIAARICAIWSATSQQCAKESQQCAKERSRRYQRAAWHAAYDVPATAAYDVPATTGTPPATTGTPPATTGTPPAVPRHAAFAGEPHLRRHRIVRATSRELKNRTASEVPLDSCDDEHVRERRDTASTAAVPQPLDGAAEPTRRPVAVPRLRLDRLLAEH
jgi:hypothetical protein